MNQQHKQHFKSPLRTERPFAGALTAAVLPDAYMDACRPNLQAPQLTV